MIGKLDTARLSRRHFVRAGESGEVLAIFRNHGSQRQRRISAIAKFYRDVALIVNGCKRKLHTLREPLQCRLPTLRQSDKRNLMGVETRVSRVVENCPGNSAVPANC